MRRCVLALAAFATLLVVGTATGSTPGGDVRLTNDCHQTGLSCGAGYLSSYTIAGLGAYTDDVLDTCSASRGRQNEPSVGVDPRNTSVIIGSSNDYCAVFPLDDPTSASGPVWLGYYRSETAGASFVSSLVPGYPGDTSDFAALAQIRTASSGDPVITWDGEGRVFLGAESSDDPAGTAKTFGDVWVARYVNPGGPTGETINDGKLYEGSTVVARGSSAPNLLGKFNDKTAIMADHNGGKCANNVYFSWSRFTGNGNNGIYFTRSRDHAATFSQPTKLSEGVHGSQFPDIAVTGNSDVYVVWRQFDSKSGQPNAIVFVRSTDCGATFTKPTILETFIPYDAQDVADPGAVPTPTVPEDEFGEEEGTEVQGNARDCGDFASHCQSGYTFFRRDTQVRAVGDQFGGASDRTVYVVYDPTKPGTEVDTGTTYGSIEVGRGSQSGVYFLSFDGQTGAEGVEPMLIHDETWGHQLFPDISADHGFLHAIWWDSHNDPAYSPMRPVGNDSSGHVYRSLDAYASSATTTAPSTWTSAVKVTDYTSNPNFEQFGGRAVPFAGDYLWVDSVGTFSYGVWTDWRDTVAGTDQREDPTLGGTPDEDDAAAADFPGAFLSSADVRQCRSVVVVPATKKSPESKTFGPDTCPHEGGLDQNIYGDYTP